MNHKLLTQLRLKNQQLSATGLQTPKDVVAWMGAMQAQDFQMAKWAIGVRMKDSTDNIVQEAFNKGKILRTHVMRPTWHFVTPEDIRWMIDLTGAKILKSMKSRDHILGLTEEIVKKTKAIFVKSLQNNQHLTKQELSVILTKHKLPADSSQMYHLLMRAELSGPICSGALKGKEHSYALMDERIPITKKITKEQALEKLARKYFTSHGPATVQDFIWWSGLSAIEAKHALELIKKDFISETINTQTYWMPHSESKTKAISLLLLPAFDEFIISYKDRQAMITAENHSKAISSNGIFRPIIVKNGEIIGIWKKGTPKNPVNNNFFETPINTKDKLLNKAIKDFVKFTNF